MKKKQQNSGVGFQARQGDVLVIASSGEASKGVQVTEAQSENGKLVLAYGEVTGHTHALMAKPGVQLFRVGPEGGTSGINVPAVLTSFLRMRAKSDIDGGLRHQEHEEIKLPTDEEHYEVRQQRQWTLERVIPVAD